MRPARGSLTAVTVVSALVLPACTLVGFLIGARSDSRKQPQVMEPAGLSKVETGRTVDLALVSGQVQRGKFLGVELLEADEYARRWARAQERLGPEVLLPPLGAAVFGADGTDLASPFQGVDPGAVVVSRPGRPGVVRLELGTVGSVGQGEQRLERATLLRLLHEGRLPARSQIALSGPGREPVRIPLEDVTTVTIQPVRHGKLTGALVGLALDALVVVLATGGDSGSTAECTPGTEGCISSCPLVYGFDGRDWVLESEVFGAAIFEHAQRTDRAMLEHLAPADGRYRLRLRDESYEIQWLDAARLVVVDHPRGTRVAPSLDGRLHLLGPAASTPPHVRDLRGNDVRSLLAARDDAAWVSDALAVAPGLRDGLEFELPRAGGATTLTLAFRARSTPWADLAKARLMALLGDGLEAWRARMESDDGARAESLAALRREGLLTLRVWDGTGWRELASLANMATVVERDLAVRVELSGLPQGWLRLRLDATPGLWTVDALEAEFDAAVADRIQVLAPLSARAADGRDLRALLSATDSRRFEMEPWLGEVALEFEVPPHHPDWQRSLALEASGHYATLSRARGPAQQARFDRLVREPGAFARFSLDLQRQAAAGGASSTQASAGAR